MSEQKFNVQDGIGFPDGTSQITAGDALGDNNIWIETFASVTPVTDIVQSATSVEYDAGGNIIALFSHVIPGAPDSRYASVAKISPSGGLLWQTRFAANLNTDGWGLAYDGSDSVYVTGSTSGTPLTYDFATLTKIDAFDGTIVWSKTYDFEANSQSAVVDVDSDLNPVMVGYADNGTDNYIITTKVDSADGSVIWSKTLDGQGSDQAYGMAVGPTGEVVTIGYTDTFGVQDAAATLYTDPVSNVNWTAGANISGGGLTCDVTFTGGVPTFTSIVDTLGNRTVDGTVATISGASFGGTSPADDMILKVGTLAANDTDDRMVVIKYNIDGTIAWQKAVQFDEGYDCTGADADIDSNGNIYVCGQYQYAIVDGTDSAMCIVKFDSAGVKQWTRRVVGNCQTFATSVVVGDNNNLYLSGITGVNNTSDFIWCVVKYDTSGALIWQRLIDNTTSWTFGGNFWFGNGGGSNIAVRNGYIALAGGYYDFPENYAAVATVLQIDTNATPFSVGDWDIKGANFTAVFNASASDITVVNAGKTTGTATPTVADFVVEEDASNFLIGTLYTAPGGNDSLVNGAYTLTLGNAGTVTLPAGGTITEGHVTSNPTIQLTPASPDVTSQKLVIKGGGNYDANNNGIALNWYVINPLVSDTVEISVYSPANANGTLYWWIYPENAGIATPDSGTVSILEGGGANNTISFVVDSDDYEFTVRVSPEDNNYDPANIGVETQLFNSSAPTFDAEHHLHLTTGNLAETSIFLGTDDHNVRTTVNGGIEITTPNTTNNVWQFSTNGQMTYPQGTVLSEFVSGPTNTFGIFANVVPGRSVTIRTSPGGPNKDWIFGTNGSLTLPGAVVNSTEAKTGVILPTTTGVVNGLTSDSVLSGLTDGSYGPFILTGVTLSVVVSGGVINGFSNISGTATVNDVLGTIDSGDIGGTAGTTITITVSGVVQATPTALDLTKSINKLTSGNYTLADGVEGQIMYLVPQDGITVAGNVGVSVANFRMADFTGTGGSLLPFRIYNGVDLMDSTGMCTLIFTDNAWQQSGGAWD